MKKILSTLLGVALVVNLVGPAFGQSQIIVGPRLKWNRGISSYGLGNTDSTRISIPSATAADFADTTAWLDLSAYHFGPVISGQALALFQINTQLTSSTDSVGFYVQYSNDLTASTIYGSVTSAASTTVTATTAGITAGQDGLAFSVVAVSLTTIAAGGVGTVATLPYRYVRLVVSNAEASSNNGRKYFSVQPVIFGWR